MQTRLAIVTECCGLHPFFHIYDLLLYDDAAVISMSFGDLGTMFEAIRVIHSGFSAAEHEYVAAYIAQKVVFNLLFQLFNLDYILYLLTVSRWWTQLSLCVG